MKVDITRNLAYILTAQDRCYNCGGTDEEHDIRNGMQCPKWREPLSERESHILYKIQNHWR